MEKSIKAFITKGEKFFLAKCTNIDVFTQGKTIPETIENLQEAIAVHLHDVSPKEYNLVPKPSLLIVLEVDYKDVAA